MPPKKQKGGRNRSLAKKTKAKKFLEFLISKKKKAAAAGGGKKRRRRKQKAQVPFGGKRRRPGRPKAGGRSGVKKKGGKSPKRRNVGGRSVAPVKKKGGKIRGGRKRARKIRRVNFSTDSLTHPSTATPSFSKRTLESTRGLNSAVNSGAVPSSPLSLYLTRVRHQLPPS